MTEVKDDFILPRVEQANGTVGHPTVIDIVDPLFVRKQNMPRPSMTTSEVVRASRAAFRSGKTKPLEYRKGQLKALLRFFEECKQDIEDVLYKDLRKHPQEVNISEIILVTNDIRHTLMDLDEWAKPKRPSKRLVNMLNDVEIHTDPYGVVLIIGAWNYPLLLTLGPLVGAIAAGNCIIMKPSELATATADLLHRTLTKYLDEETFHVVLGGIPETTELLAERFDYIFFTGSTAVGKIVHQAAAKHLTPTTLELGGKSPCYIDDTVDMEIAARRILWGKFMNAGQTCICPDYVICTQEVQEAFLAAAKKILFEFYGDQKFPSDLSRIISENHFKRLLQFLESSKVAIGGHYLESQKIISPTILVNVKKTDKVMSEEIFGPILPILNVSNCDEAIDYILDNEKPLALYVFSQDKKVHKRFLEETSSGSLSINDTIMQICTENLPFGGVGGSGMGAYHGEEGFKTFSHQKSVLKTMLNSVTELGLQSRYPPYSQTKINLLHLILQKRRGIPLKYISNILLFLIGFAVAFIFHRMFNHHKEHSE
ncbi:aldehyde dehydrogenase, dimeric NADP-preferring-like [Harmonia axyridis]|uniref:aldehyde dehydrogenase, dimeric NADP-preferring-like n=1 Tax=Harmonia axyridis TaxID=115357 RepID=UPI001E279ACD|nr:aldehyde dehydrogenase, dimeric NADP-preferring-like [Harmonia axyridis]